MNEYIEIASKGLREMKNYLYKQTVKSQDDLNKPETHSTEVLLSTIEELERTKKQLEIAVNGLERVNNISNNQEKGVQSLVNQIVSCWLASHSALKQIKDIEK